MPMVTPLAYERYVKRERESGTEQSGGDFYNNQNTRVGELFANQVLRAAMEGRIGFKEAYDLTGLRGGTFQKYAASLNVCFDWAGDGHAGGGTPPPSP